MEFKCDDFEYPLVICALDTEGDHWWLDGDYVLQNQTYNRHRIWHKEGFYLLDYWIFLHTNNNTEPWYWAITADPQFENDNLIQAKCDIDYRTNNISEPSQCPRWSTTNTPRYPNLFSPNNNFTASSKICEISDRYICVDSSQSALGIHATN